MRKSKEVFMDQRQHEEQQETNPYQDLINKIDHEELVLSYSSLKRFYDTPRSFVKYKLKKFERNAGMLMGTITECLILNEELFHEQFIVMDKIPSTENQISFCNDIIAGLSKQNAFDNNYKSGTPEKVFEAVKDYINAKMSGKEIISKKDKDVADEIAKAVKKNPAVAALLERLQGIQYKLEWTHNGLRFIAYLDGLGDNFILDLKFKSQSADIDKFQFDFKNLRYDLQSGMYCHGVEQNNIIPNPDYYIIVYDKNGESSVIKIDQSYIMYGKHMYEFCIQEFKRCRAENAWDQSHDFYGNNGVHTLIRPNYAKLKGVLKD